MEEKPSNPLTGQQQFNLRWNNHTNNILQVFIEQFTNETLVDVTLSCEGQYIKAHKMILSACSPYFQDLFRVHTVAHPLIIIYGMKYTDVKQVIDFMYRGEVKILETELDSLLAVAESLQVKGLSNVRNTYEKHEKQSQQLFNIQQTNNNEIVAQMDKQISNSSLSQTKKRKLSNMEETISPETTADDSSLSNTIKIEPPEIRDIDQEEANKTDYTNETLDNCSILPSKSIKTSKTGRMVRSKNYVPNLPAPMPTQASVDTYSIPNLSTLSTTTTTATITTTTLTPKKMPNYTSQGFIDPANKALKIPRPPNAFMIFANEWRKKLATENPKESNKEISIRLGVMWKSLSSDEKEGYYSASRKADEEHKRKYPGYYYSPKEARIRKNLKETLTPAKNKNKNCDAMRFVKLVMKDNNEIENERWRLTAEHSSSDDKEIIDDPDDMSVNVESDDDTRSEVALQIDTSPENNTEADSSSSHKE